MMEITTRFDVATIISDEDLPRCILFPACWADEGWPRSLLALPHIHCATIWMICVVTCHLGDQLVKV